MSERDEREPPRYYVRKHTGYLAPNVGGTTTPPCTEVMVLDRAYCHRVVWSSLWTMATRSTAALSQHTRHLADHRVTARSLARRWNAEEALWRRSR